MGGIEMITLDTIDSAFASIAVKSSSGTELNIDSFGFITSNINGTVTVSGTDFDIRDLLSSQDSVAIKSSGGQEIAIDGSGNLTVNQGTSPWAVSVGNVSTWKNTVESISNTATQIVSTPLSSRFSLLLQNLSNRDIWIGPDNTVTTSNGIKIPKGSSAEFSFDDAADIYAISDSASGGELRISEFAS